MIKMKKWLSVLLLAPLLCGAETIELAIEECSGKLIDTIRMPFPFTENSISTIESDTLKLGVKFMDRIGNDYLLNVNISRTIEKSQEINITTKIRLSTNEKIAIGGFCSHQDNKGIQYFLTIK